MKTVEVSQSALESLQKMVEQLQGERDELLDAVYLAHRFVDDMPHAHMNGYRAKDVRIALDKTIAKCTAKPEVLE